MMDLSPHYSASSSEASSGGESGGPHVRTLRLIRRGTFGFSVRGGREHGTGFFVSAVEVGSEAHCQGLRVGDQIMRVNGFPVDNAVHQEILQLVQRQTHINLKVRTVGMIPVKDKCNDPLTWRLVEEEAMLQQACIRQENRENVSSIKIGSGECEVKDIRILLEVAAKTKLGCGICKGPEWKPGIFIQYTKEKGVAREAGLRPGDQILQCNGVTFSHTEFNQAVEVLKSARQLDLIIRKGAGFDLFPGESSGYNSSASSVNGDMSPSWGDAKRLSIVREEAAVSEGDERLMQMDRGSLFRGKQWTACEQNGNDCVIESEGKPTVIHIRDAGGRSSSENDLKLAEICMISQQQETTTVIVEVHRSELDDNGVSRTHNGNHHGQLSKSLSSNSFASASSTSSLGSALSQELHRRIQRKETDSARDQRRKTLLKTVDKEEEERHQKLMTEFKMAHRKMFRSTDNLQETKEREPTPVKTVAVQPQVTRATAPPPPPMPPDGVNGIPPACPTPDYDTLSVSSLNTDARNVVTLNAHSKHISGNIKANDSMNKNAKAIPSESITKNHGVNVNKTIAIISPKPSQSSNEQKSVSEGDRVEMISIESFTLNNPSSPKPKPPATYFGSKKAKPVAVTIGEYKSGVDRRRPARFDFLAPGSSSTELQSELAQTLSRSNLRKQTDPQENDLKGAHKETTTTKGMVNNCLVSQTDLVHRKFTKNPNSTTYSSCVQTIKNITPTSKSSISPLIKNAAEKITIRIPTTMSSEASSEVPTGTLNGILKNNCGSGTSVTELNSGKHRTVSQQKSISFGEITTLINDPAQAHT